MVPINVLMVFSHTVQERVNKNILLQYMTTVKLGFSISQAFFDRQQCPKRSLNNSMFLDDQTPNKITVSSSKIILFSCKTFAEKLVGFAWNKISLTLVLTIKYPRSRHSRINEDIHCISLSIHYIKIIPGPWLIIWHRLTLYKAYISSPRQCRRNWNEFQACWPPDGASVGFYSIIMNEQPILTNDTQWTMQNCCWLYILYGSIKSYIIPISFENSIDRYTLKNRMIAIISFVNILFPRRQHLTQDITKWMRFFDTFLRKTSLEEFQLYGNTSCDNATTVLNDSQGLDKRYICKHHDVVLGRSAAGLIVSWSGGRNKRCCGFAG